ncbi:ribosomal L7Ae/L30e/S12e/Gadd45 family protein [Vallitalea guaymasensis]|uniref:Ribosomal L7Ae/L30e/S12e/Gadd45 family protein n=1 Tax=Vallitalea guaymasensis TaxID=1185412 RepID=A0A8J8MF51_9FIRM|nr:ribosomal L7Ae/L30e/S12e/Gadd45 family protein [Vallitalea guaymasensis]
MYVHRLKTNSKVIGMKQTLKALENEEVEVLYVAKDAQDEVTTRHIELAASQQIPVVYIDTMEELGSVCDVEVKTATAALIK